MDEGNMAEIALWLSAGVGKGMSKEPRMTEEGPVLVSSNCCTAGPELEVEPWIGSAAPEILEISATSGIASLVTTSSELVRGCGLTKAG
jgi:hypothetical protein